MKGLFMKKEKRNRIISALMVLVMGVLLMTGCGEKSAEKEDAETLTVYLWSTTLYDKYAPYIQEQLPDINIEFVVGMVVCLILLPVVDFHSMMQVH